jgi:gamma-glutamyl-gamma-aminobutyrate hydrolase PuuD
VTPVDHSDADGRARTAMIHRVRLDPGSRLAQLIDETSIEVNSLHHQAVKAVAPRLRVTGTSDDGVIEALESADHRFLIAVQWHPEEIDTLPWVQRLFGGFARAATSNSPA